MTEFLTDAVLTPDEFEEKMREVVSVTRRQLMEMIHEGVMEISGQLMEIVAKAEFVANAETEEVERMAIDALRDAIADREDLQAAAKDHHMRLN